MFQVYLENAIANLAKMMEPLREASLFAFDLENGLVDDMSVFDSGSVQDFLYEQYVLHVPEGIAKRLAENEQVERELEDMEVNWLGHLFTYRRPEFWTCLKRASSDLRKRMLTFGTHHPPVSSTVHALSQVEFKRLYCQHDDDAYAWQYAYDDTSEEDSDLLTLLRLLRQVAQG